jgi:hypothetical protein
MPRFKSNCYPSSGKTKILATAYKQFLFLLFEIPVRWNVDHHVIHHATLLVQAPAKIFKFEHWVVLSRRGVNNFNMALGMANRILPYV